jgi:hypothetical protein
MSPEKKPNLAAIRIIPELQVPPIRSRHDAVHAAVHEMIKNLPKGKALQIDCKALGVGGGTLISRIKVAQKAGLIPKDIEAGQRSTVNGPLVFVRWSKPEAER